MEAQPINGKGLPGPKLRKAPLSCVFGSSGVPGADLAQKLISPARRKRDFGPTNVNLRASLVVWKQSRYSSLGHP